MILVSTPRECGCYNWSTPCPVLGMLLCMLMMISALILGTCTTFSAVLWLVSSPPSPWYLAQCIPTLGWRGQARIRYQSRSLGNTWLVTIIYRNIYFSANNFPSFCAGLAYLLTKSAIQRLVYEYEEGRDFLWLDDVFISGVLARKAGVKLLDIKVTVLVRKAGVKVSR